MKILVTGAAGFIGSHVCDELLERGHHVVGMDNLRNGKLTNLAQAQSSDRFEFQQADILEPAHCARAVEGCDVVYHLACLGVRHSIHSPFENHRVNGEGTLRVLAAALEAAVGRFFYISTSEVYGKTVGFPIKETDPTLPLTVYGASKLAGEHYALSYHECYGLDSTVLRIFNNYGPRAHHEGDCGEVIPRSIVRMLYGQNPVIFGDGAITRDFFFVTDTAALLADLLDTPGLTGQTFNVGTGVEITMKALLQKLVDLMPDRGVELEFMAARPADVPRLWVDNSRLWSILGERELMDFEAGLRQTIAYYEQQQSERDLSAEVDLVNWTKD